MLRSAPTLQPVRLGQHELLIRLASGGAANVFLVRDLSSPKQDRLLALKILLPSLASNEDFLNMFFTEARIASRLQHEHVVAITGFGQVDGIHCLAMEYVFGASLAQVLRASARAKKPLTVGVLLRITASVCDALHFAHEMKDEEGESMGLVHRDVTPQNILIGFNGVPKLTDFGIAKATGRGWETQAGIVKGKFSYMSPEQALGKKVDRRSDIFGTGIVLWEALTGRDLFRGSTPMEVLTAIREQKIEPPSKVVPGLTPIVDPIVMKALRRSPRQRYQTAAEMRDDILDLIRRAGVEIDADTIAREFYAIYGDEIGQRAVELRKAMAGKPDIEALARVLGGQALNQKHLPVIPGGVTDPDPLGLFSEETPANGKKPMAASASSPPQISDERPQGTRTDFEIVDVVSEMAPHPRTLGSEETGVRGWNEAQAEPDEDDLLSMLSEEDATIGLLPKEFAARFGARLEQAREEEERLGHFEDDEMTVGVPSGTELSRIRMIADDDSMGPWDESPPLYEDPVRGSPGLRATGELKALPSGASAERHPALGVPADRRAATGAPGERPPAHGAADRRPVPRAPSLDIGEDGNEATRPFVRPPAIDLDELDRTPPTGHPDNGEAGSSESAHDDVLGPSTLQARVEAAPMTENWSRRDGRLEAPRGEGRSEGSPSSRPALAHVPARSSSHLAPAAKDTKASHDPSKISSSHLKAATGAYRPQEEPGQASSLISETASSVSSSMLEADGAFARSAVLQRGGGVQLSWPVFGALVIALLALGFLAGLFFLG